MKIKLWLFIAIICMSMFVGGCTQNSSEKSSSNEKKVIHQKKEPKTSIKTNNTKASNVTTTTTPKNLFFQLFLFNNTSGWASTDKKIFVKNEDKWVDVTPHHLNKQNESLSLYAFNKNLVWVANKETLFKSKDGGKTWSSTSIPKSQADINTTRVDLSLINSTTGWMLVHHGYAAGLSPFDIYQTTNQGASWKLVDHVGAGTKDVHNIPANKDPRSITFIDEKHGFISGEGNNPHEIIFYKTNDAGRTWEQQDVPLPKMGPDDLIEFSTPQFFNKNNAILTVTIKGMKKNNTIIYTTSNQGNNWKKQSKLEGVGEVTFLNSKIGWEIVKHSINDDASTLYQTKDGGKSWSKVAGLTFTLKNLKFTSPQLGWGINEKTAQILQSIDGGRVWK